MLYFLRPATQTQEAARKKLWDTDTVGVEKEYEVEKKYREVTVDTVVETETIEKEIDPDSE